MQLSSSAVGDALGHPWARHSNAPAHVCHTSCTTGRSILHQSIRWSTWIAYWWTATSLCTLTWPAADLLLICFLRFLTCPWGTMTCMYSIYINYFKHFPSNYWCAWTPLLFPQATLVGSSSSATAMGWFVLTGQTLIFNISITNPFRSTAGHLEQFLASLSTGDLYCSNGFGYLWYCNCMVVLGIKY